jgi:hypothetical protein
LDGPRRARSHRRSTRDRARRATIDADVIALARNADVLSTAEALEIVTAREFAGELKVGIRTLRRRIAKARAAAAEVPARAEREGTLRLVAASVVCCPLSAFGST